MAAAAHLLARDAASLAVVIGAAAALLRALDVLPQIVGEPAGGRPFARIDEVERRLGERLALPAYFPQSLQWPPSRIRVGGRRPAVVVVAFRGAGQSERAILGQTIGGARPLPPGLWPQGLVLDSAEVDLGPVTGTLERILGEDGQTWRELRWRRWGRQFALRSLGSDGELVQMARSVRRERP